MKDAQGSSPAVPRRHLLTPFNLISGVVLLGGLAIVGLRFVKGIGATTNLSHTTPWGLWNGFKLVAVALAAGGYVTSAAVYIFGLKEYKPLVRPAILTGFLGYALVGTAVIIDLGRPWRIPYPFFVQAGPTSALFEISLCVALYLSTLFVELSPAIFEWLGWQRWRKAVVSLTVALTIFGLILSTLHQSTLGALYLIMPSKLHPLWYSSFIPVHFFVSSVAAGLAMVMLISWFSQRLYRHEPRTIERANLDRLTLGLAKALAVVLAIYLAIKVLSLAQGDSWSLLTTPLGWLFLLEILGAVLLPCFLATLAVREQRPRLARIAALITVLGIGLNRLNVAIFVFNWRLPRTERYLPHWMEIWVTLSLLVVGMWAFCWIVRRMPILYEHPDYRD